MPGGTSAPLNAVLASRSTLARAAERARARSNEPVRQLDRLVTLPVDDQSGDVVAHCVLWSEQWTVDALTELCEELGDRRLIMVEPAPGLGPRRLAQWLLTYWWRRRLGYDYNRDLPIELRRAGFEIHTIDRFTVGRLTIRTYFYAELAPRRFP